MITLEQIPEQVRNRIEITDSCWLWRGTVAKNGYGVVKIGGRKGKLEYVHRLVARIQFGDLPKGLFVCHICDNPICCNPEHFFLGLPFENAVDAASKGRMKGPHLKGEMNPSAKLDTRDVIQIRELHDSGCGLSDIAMRFGVNKCTVWSIVKGKTWKHV
jgi:hypothetical protein